MADTFLLTSVLYSIASFQIKYLLAHTNVLKSNPLKSLSGHLEFLHDCFLALEHVGVLYAGKDKHEAVSTALAVSQNFAS